MLLTPSVSAEDFDVDQYLSKTYITLGAGYKFMETDIVFRNSKGEFNNNNPISARIELGYQYSKNIRFGISHHSQWLAGWPINDDAEYGKTELFIDYTFNLGSK